MPINLRPRRDINYSEKGKNSRRVSVKDNHSLLSNKVKDISLNEPVKSKKRKSLDSNLTETFKKRKLIKKLGIYTTGENDMGQLGFECENSDVFSMVNIAEKKWLSIVCGGVHTASLTTNGLVYTWGCNDEAALGRKTEEPDDDEKPIVGKSEKLPGQIVFKKANKVIAISAGDSHTCLLTDNGNVYICGNIRDSNGPIGLTLNGEKSYEFICIYELNDPAIAVESGCDHVLILTKSGKVYTFGNGEQGQLGRIKLDNNEKTEKSELLTAKCISTLNVKHVVKIGCGSYHSLCVTDDNEVYCWGLDNYGQLGINQGDTIISRSVPTISKDLTEICKKNTIKKICGGQHHTLILTNNGNVYSFGRHDYGRLGLGKTIKEPQFSPQLVNLHKVVEIFCGDSVSFMINEQSELYGCGMVTSKQLGIKDEDENDIYIPSKIPIDNVKTISSGGQHSALLAYI